MNDHDDALEEGANAAAGRRSNGRGSRPQYPEKARTTARNVRRSEDGDPAST